MSLPTNYKDDILNTEVNEVRRYNVKKHSDDSVVESDVYLEDITDYTQEGSALGASGVNAITTEINSLNNNLSYSLDGDSYPFRIGVDDNGNVGYYKGGADTVTPFSSDRIPTNIPFTTSDAYAYTADSDGYVVYHLGTQGGTYIARLLVNDTMVDEARGGVVFKTGYYQIHKGDVIKAYVSNISGDLFAQCVFIPNVYHIEQCGASGYAIQNGGLLITLLHMLYKNQHVATYENLNSYPIIQPFGSTNGNYIEDGAYGINQLCANKCNQGDVITYAVGHGYNRIGNWVVW